MSDPRQGLRSNRLHPVAGTSQGIAVLKRVDKEGLGMITARAAPDGPRRSYQQEGAGDIEQDVTARTAGNADLVLLCYLDN